MKQFVLPLFEPLGATWTLMTFSLAYLLCRKQWRSGIWLGVPTLLIFLVGSTPLAEALVAAAERPWATSSIEAQSHRFNDGSPFDAVVVLGGGCDVSAHDLYGFVLNAGGSRALTGVEVVRLNKAKNLVLGGSEPVDEATDSPVMARVGRWIDAWGLVSVPLMTLGTCRNTHEEAVAFKKLQTERHWKQAALVTSALHMRRSAGAFRKEGVEVVPVACDFQVFGVPPLRFSIFPHQERFRLLSLFMHEKIGWWYYRWKGWV